MPAWAGIFDDDEARRAILDLRVKLETLSKQTDDKLTEKADKTALLDLANQNENLRSEIARLRGQIELLTNDLVNAQKRQQDFYLDLDTRLQKLEPKRVTVDGKEAMVEGNEQRAYDTAMSLFKAGSYKESAAGFATFLSAYPQSVFAGSALYWLGNAQYAQRDCKSVLVTMQQLVKTYPQHPKAPDAMLNIADCQIDQKDKAASHKTLLHLIADYPETDAAQAAKNRLKLLK